MNKVSNSDSGIIHDWVYVIIPVDNRPLFSAFCKQCRCYFSEFVQFLERQPLITESNVPKYGCNPIDGIKT